MTAVLAVDVGGTRMKAALIDDERITKQFVRNVTSDPSPVEQIGNMVAALGERPSDAVLGVCIPGLVDDAGRSSSLPGKLRGLEGMDVRGYLSDRFGLPAIVVNDAVAYGTGEAVLGAGADATRVLVVIIGTGIGVCVIDRSLPPESWLRGNAGLGGFIPLSDRTDGPGDSMGRPDTIEALCCAARIVDCARATGASVDTVEEVLQARARGDDMAGRGLEVYRARLIRALLALSHAHAPDTVVVGGGPLADSDVLLEGVEPGINRQLFPGMTVSVRPAALGDGAALLGLSVIARHRANRPGTRDWLA